MNSIVFGCPRSGTSYIYNLFKQYTNAIKLKEVANLHPVKSENGLLHISELMQDDKIIFIRTIRNPIDIVKSFYNARLGGIEKYGTLSSRTDDEIIDYIRNEHTSFYKQKEQFSYYPYSSYKIKFINIKYENMKISDGIHDIISHVSKAYNNNPMAVKIGYQIQKTFNKPEYAARRGQLSDFQEYHFTKEKYNFFKEKLNSIAEKEGYML